MVTHTREPSQFPIAGVGRVLFLKKSGQARMAPPRISRKPGLGGREHFLVRGFAHADNLSNLQHKLPFRHEQAEI